MEAQRCLYEVLGVERTSSNDEIRSAYRKLALKWHPDKIQQSGASPESCEEATALFQEIGRAYEVLSDPSERSWYDSHRSQILNNSSSSSAFSSDYEFNPWPYFSPSVFSGYGDSGKGFYAVYGKLFADLHRQEQGFSRSHGLKMPADPPEMGGMSTPYVHVQKFYSFWLSFGTVKDFSWCDEYRASDGFNRKIRRLMEEENKKIRSKARKEFNEAIRRLAAFVKKRDKRVLERQLEVQKLEKKKEEMLKLKRKKEEEEKIMKARLYEEAEWTKISTVEHAMDDDGSDIDDSIGSYSWVSKSTESKKERRDEEFYCIVCNKKFKSDKQWKNHERSKKHLDRVASLKESFQEEDEEMKAIFSMEELESNEGILNDDIRGTRHREENGLDVEGVEVCDVKPRLEKNTEKIENGEVEDDGVCDVHSVTEDDEEENDELNSLSSMVYSYMNRKELDGGANGDSVSESEDEIGKKRTGEGEKKIEQVKDQVEVKEEGENEEEGEEGEGEEGEGEEMLIAMMRSRQSMKPTQDDEDQEDADEQEMLMDTTRSHHSIKQPEDDEEKEDDGSDIALLDNTNKSKKKKSKTSLRNERKQAASFNRHSAFVEELSLGNVINKVARQFETLGMEDYKLSFSDQPSQSTTAVSEIHHSEMETNVDNRQQFKVVKESKVSKGSKMVSQTDSLRISTKAKKSKGNAKNATNTCETCGEDFETRNQLFKHISITQHAILKGK